MESNTQPTQSGERVSQGLQGVRQRAKENKQERFTALLHHVTPQLLEESYYAIKRKAAPGVDGVTWQEYGIGLTERLSELHSRVHRGAYRAQPSRRIYIPKANGKQRPLGIAALEDKIVQHAVVTVLNAIYEEDFRGFSYGFRPGRSQHTALDALYVALKRKNVNRVLDIDIKGFFDNLDKELLVEMIEQRIADPRIVRLIQKWLNAGIVVDGNWPETETGRDSARGSGLTAAIERVPALRARSVDRPMAARRTRRRAHRSLCRRRHHWVSARKRSAAIPAGSAGTAGRVRAGTEPRQDPVDPVRTLCPAKSGRAWRGKTRVVHLSWAFSTFVRTTAWDVSKSGASPTATGGARNCWRSSRSYADGCTKRSPGRGNGCGAYSTATTNTTRFPAISRC